MSSSHRWGTGNIFKRGNKYWIQWYRNGKRYLESARTEDERKAEKLLADKLKSPDAPAAKERRLTFEELKQALLNNYRIRNNRTSHLAELALRRLETWFGGDRVVDITAGRVEAYTAHRLEEGELSSSSINYDLAILRRALNVLKDTGRISSVPKITLLPPAEPRQGFVDPPEFVKLRDELPDDLRDPVSFLYLSGWRVNEMRTLEWRDLDLPGRAIRLRPENSKNKTARIVKLKGELLEIITRAESKRHLDCVRVFHRDGQPIGDFRKAWATACKGAGLGKLLVHDLRRSSIRNMVRAGVHERIAMDISGHKTRTIFERYNIVAEADLDAAAARVDRYVKARQKKAPKVVPIRRSA